MTLFASEPL